jgi:DNA-binding transcriptional ArsR family regulator
MTYRTATARTFDALGDPTRRVIYERLSRRPASVGELAKGLPVSRPAVSQHLKVLREARLVDSSQEGTRRIYAIDPQGLGPLREWLDRHWDQALEAFKQVVEADEEDDKR